MKKPSPMWSEIMLFFACIVFIVLGMPAGMGFFVGVLANLSQLQTYTAIIIFSAIAAGGIILISTTGVMHAIKVFIVIPTLRLFSKESSKPTTNQRYAFRLNIINVCFSIGIGLIAALSSYLMTGSVSHEINGQVFMLWSVLISAVIAIVVSAFSFLLIDHFIVDDKVRIAQNTNKFEKGKL